jgi:hypothetical protein
MRYDELTSGIAKMSVWMAFIFQLSTSSGSARVSFPRKEMYAFRTSPIPVSSCHSKINERDVLAVSVRIALRISIARSICME